MGCMLIRGQLWVCLVFSVPHLELVWPPQTKWGRGEVCYVNPESCNWRSSCLIRFLLFFFLTSFPVCRVGDYFSHHPSLPPSGSDISCSIATVLPSLPSSLPPSFPPGLWLIALEVQLTESAISSLITTGTDSVCVFGDSQGEIFCSCQGSSFFAALFIGLPLISALFCHDKMFLPSVFQLLTDQTGSVCVLLCVMNITSEKQLVTRQKKSVCLKVVSGKVWTCSCGQGHRGGGDRTVVQILKYSGAWEKCLSMDIFLHRFYCHSCKEAAVTFGCILYLFPASSALV